MNYNLWASIIIPSMMRRGEFHIRPLRQGRYGICPYKLDQSLIKPIYELQFTINLQHRNFYFFVKSEYYGKSAPRC